MKKTAYDMLGDITEAKATLSQVKRLSKENKISIRKVSDKAKLSRSFVGFKKSDTIYDRLCICNFYPERTLDGYVVYMDNESSLRYYKEK